ncbi:hypothetical protein [Limnohabitans sp. Hippo4]|uniref:hypothetical protein n=1 Tax=Limnohabitans sp. Hippo4 TaxID=1826167 RepID=UPI000D36F0C5|nr:hypothetical protein [Limnohabitans sp. Hippo4]PUE35519.1 hypothetical protein B9Z46_10755 [Limnohabitans sp. Hippo4]
MEKSRQELFEMVWQTPMIHLAKQLNVSDVGLRKICIKHGIPLPERGHWTQKQFGQEEPQPELPYRNHSPAITFPDDVQAERVRAIGKLIKTAKHQFETEPISRTIEQLHDIRAIRTAEAIKAFIKDLEKQTGQSFDSVKNLHSKWPPTNLFTFSYFYSGAEQIPIVATAKNALRALCIADEIIERLASQGIEVDLTQRRRDMRYELIAKKGRETYQIEFREPWSKAGKTAALSKLYKLETGRDSWYDYVEAPKNILQVKLGGTYGKAFQDSRQRLEFQVEKIVDHIIWKLNDLYQWREECDAREREYERKKAIRQHNERIIADREEQLNIALDESERYASFQRLDEYLMIVQDAVLLLPANRQKIGLDLY